MVVVLDDITVFGAEDTAIADFAMPYQAHVFEIVDNVGENGVVRHLVCAISWICGYFGLDDRLAARRVVRAEHSREGEAMETHCAIGHVDRGEIREPGRIEPD